MIYLTNNHCQEGAGHSVVSAFVEIVFDNSDNRIPVSSLIYSDFNLLIPIYLLESQVAYFVEK